MIMLTYLFKEYLWEESNNLGMNDFSRALMYNNYNSVGPSEYTDMRKYKAFYLTLPRLFFAFRLLKIKWVEVPEKDDKNGMGQIRQTKLGMEILQFIHFSEFLHLRVNEIEVNLLKMLVTLDCGTEDVEAFMQPETISGDVIYILKVELGSCMRKIRIGGKATLEDLHEAIQRAVDFDNDHTYCFTIGFGRTKRSYYHPYCEEEPYLVDEVSLQEILLYENMKFEYLFDFGDCWRFGITVEKILPEYTENAGVIEQKGKNPEQ